MAIDEAGPLLVAVALKTTCLFAMAMGVTTAMRRASAASRYRVRIATLAAAGLLPIAAATLPPVAVRVLAPIVPVASAPSAQPAAAKAPSVFDTRTMTPGPIGTIAFAPLAPRRAWSWTGAVLTAWLGGFFVLALRQFRGAISAQTLVRSCSDAPSDVVERARVAAMRIGLGRRVRIRIADAPVLPMTCGVFPPSVVLPRLSRGWSGERLDAVLAHELAHCARFDTLTNQIAQMATSLCWWHPLAWVALRRARLDRERACDDRVLADGRRASDYAEDLVTIIEGLPSPKAETVAVGRRSDLERRVDALLDVSTNHRSASRASFGVATLVIATSLAGASTHLAARAAAPFRPKSLDIVLAQTTAEARPNAARPVVRRSIAPVAVATEGETPQATTLAMAPADQQWRAERAEMFQQLTDRAKEHVLNALVQIRIGTMAQIDVAEPEQLAEELARDAAEAVTTGEPGALGESGAERAIIRARFDEAIRDLKKVETRFLVGLSNVHELDAALMTAADVLRKPATASLPEWDRPLSDAALAIALKCVAAIPHDAARADALLTLAQHNAFSPDAVALYVQAASAITATADRARVFSQPIRVKPAGAK